MHHSPCRRDVLKALMSAPILGLACSPRMNGLFAQELPPGVPGELVQSVRDRINQGLARGESTGVALALVDSGRVVWEEGFGWSDREAGVRITPHSAFNLESVTKPFSTTLVTTLAASGKLDLDQPANRYLSASKIVGGNGDAEKATVRRLGAHCSGLPGTFEALYGGIQSPAPDAFLHRFGRLAFPPGEVWEYSNVAFEALGGVVWDLTGTDFGVLMERNVLGPLGMRDSFWDTNTARIAQSVPRYDRSGRKLPFHLSTTPPSGELLSSAHDLAKFALWNMKLPVGGGSPLLDGHWIDELHKPVFTGITGAMSTFGWAREQLASGETVIHKGGGGPGASTVVCFVPERKLACVVLSNHRSETLVNAVCDQIMRSYLPAWKTLSENGQPPPSPFVITEDLAGAWKGTLINDGVQRSVEMKITSSEAASIRIASDPPLTLHNLQSEGKVFLAETAGTIHSPDPITATAHTLRLKLLPYRGRLVGRINAFDVTPDHEGGIPYVLSLARGTHA